MNPKATKDMAQLKPAEFINEVAKGINLLFENVNSLAHDAEFLCEAKRWRSAHIQRAFAEEEAAKVLILLDAIRCPRQGATNHNNLVETLGGFNQHLAKGIYIEYCSMAPITFHDAKEYTGGLRAELYVDSGDYQVWIGRNKILQDREDLIYVSRVRNSGIHSWNSPTSYPDQLRAFGSKVSVSPILNLVGAMERCGFGSEAALHAVAGVWQPVNLSDDFHISKLEALNKETLMALEKIGALKSQNTYDWDKIIRDWKFPLYSVDLSIIPVKPSKAEAWKAQHEYDFYAELY